MKESRGHSGVILPVLIGGTVVVCAFSAHAQPEAVTQFAPLDESPIPVGPSAPAHSNASGPTPQPSFTQSDHIVSGDGVTQARPTVFTGSEASTHASVSPPAQTPPQPLVGSSWLGAPNVAAAPTKLPPPPPPVVDSGLPVFVKPSPSTPNRDVAPKEEKSKDDDETHRVAVTFSLARAFLLPAVVPEDVKNTALYEGTIELKVFERLSVAVLGGVGGFDVPLAQLGENVHVTGKELGGQARVYLFGDFDHGLTIGGEYLRLWAEADPINVEAVPPPPLPPGEAVLTGEATLTGLGAFLGYKYTAGFGLTFDAKLGIQKLTADGEGQVSGDVGPQYPTLTESETFHYDQLVPLVNVNVGWAI